MSPAVVVRPEAESDLGHAYRWYEEKSEGLGEAFLLSYEACASLFQRMPLLFPRVHGTVRRALLRRFPYMVFYSVGEDAIEVIAVLHVMRNPRRWRERI